MLLVLLALLVNDTQGFAFLMARLVRGFCERTRERQLLAIFSPAEKGTAVFCSRIVVPIRAQVSDPPIRLEFIDGTRGQGAVRMDETAERLEATVGDRQSN